MNKFSKNIKKFTGKVKRGFSNFITKENGDTNFISIVIVLVIVLVVAAVFIGFKDDIMLAVSNVMDKFLEVFNKQNIGG